MQGDSFLKFHILYLWSGDGFAINRVYISGVYYMGARWIFNLNFCRAGIALCWDDDDDDDAFVVCFAGERRGVL